MSDLQALPTQFENTAATWQNMPGFAAAYTGQQNQIAQDNNAALQQAFANEQLYKAQERPVTLQNLVNTGQLTAAQSRNQDALSRYHNVFSDLQEGLNPSQIMAGAYQNIGKAAEAQVETGASNEAFNAQKINILAARPAPQDPASAREDAINILNIAHHPVTEDSIQHILANRDEAVKALKDEVNQRAQAAAMGTPKSRLVQAGLDVKTQISEDRFNQAVSVEGMRVASVAASNAAATARAIAVVQEKAMNDYKNQGTAFKRQAMAETDPAKRAALEVQADKANSVAQAMLAVSQQTANEAKLGVAALIDPKGVLGVKLPTPSMPSVQSGPPGVAQLAPAQPAPATQPTSTSSLQDQMRVSPTQQKINEADRPLILAQETLNPNLKLEDRLALKREIERESPQVQQQILAHITRLKQNPNASVVSATAPGVAAVIPNPVSPPPAAPVPTPVLPRVANRPSYAGWLAAKEAKDKLYNEAANMSPDRRDIYLNSRLPEIEQALKFHSGYLNSR